MEEDMSKVVCNVCSNVGLADGLDGYFYCTLCGSRAEDIMDTGVADEDFVDKGGDARGGLYQPIYTRTRHQSLTPSQPLSQQDTLHSQFWSQLTSHSIKDEVRDDQVNTGREEHYDGLGPTDPADFGSSQNLDAKTGLTYEDYYGEVRSRYVMGVQMMLQQQCEALVERFKLTPLICGLVAPIWLSFVAHSGVCGDGWADDAVQDSERQTEEDIMKRPARHKAEPHNLLGQRAIIIWVRALRRSIPLSSSLAISFLACHISREWILPTDIVRWALEGKLPFFSSFIEIAKQMGDRSPACPVSASIMFKPSRIVSSQKIESLAASIADKIGLSLPPVNFYEIALHYLKQLSLPVDKILPRACRIQQWSMPSDLYLSKNELRLPTRVCVMSILIVTIRIIYNLNGFGVWERSLSITCNGEEGASQVSSSESKSSDHDGAGDSMRDMDDSGSKSLKNQSNMRTAEFNAEELLRKLEAKYYEIVPSYEYSKDLRTYLEFCKDVVFAGTEESSYDNEYKTVEDLWDFYINGKDIQVKDQENESPDKRKRIREISLSPHMLSVENGEEPSDKGSYPNSSPLKTEIVGSDNSFSNQAMLQENQKSTEALKEKAIRRLKSDMKDNRFCYIPPRVKLRRFDYLHYARKRDDGSLTYVAHADYYILLRVCARAAQVDARIMHLGVLSFERRLAWLEKRIEHCLHITPPKMTCKFCDDKPQGLEEDVEVEDPIGLSN